MSYPNYIINGRHVCQHIFCDGRVNRAIATHKVTQVRPSGNTWITLVCDDHIHDIRKVLRDTDSVESLTTSDQTAKV